MKDKIINLILGTCYFWMPILGYFILGIIFKMLGVDL